MDEAIIRSKMQQVIDLLISDVGSIRTGRATSSLVDSVTVAVYGGTQKLRIQELATVTVPDAQTIVIDPWDKSIIGEIRQGILSANIGMNPSIDGELIRVAFPPLTTEDREKYVRLLSAKMEGGKVAIRQVRGDAMQEIKKSFEAKELSEDEKFDLEKNIQAITDEFVGKIDEIGGRKKIELLQI